MHRFFLEEIQNGHLFLTKAESKHAIKVFRLRQDDIISIMDGAGSEYICKITVPNPKKCQFAILHQNRKDRPSYRIHLAIAPTKNIDRIEWMVEKCTEMGIDELSFFYSSNSERKVMKLERLIKKTISAIKQSNNYFLPKLNQIVSFKSLLNNLPDDCQRLIGHLNQPTSKHLVEVAKPVNSYLILIGPEGDFTAGEVEYATSIGFIPVTLGKLTLRTETAGLFSVAVLNSINHLPNT